MNAADYPQHMRLVSLIVNLIRELPIVELRLANGARFANLRFTDGDQYARELHAIRDDAETVRILADAQDQLRALKAAIDARRTRRENLDPSEPLNPTASN